MAYEIKAPEQKYLEVYLGDSDKPKRVPLAESLPATWLIRINRVNKIKDESEQNREWFELFYDLFREYLGPVVDAFTASQLNELSEAWSNANEEESGATAGE